MSQFTGVADTMPALGRPFQLGTLYDARVDAVVPGYTLWTDEQLSNNIQKHTRNAQQRFEIEERDSIQDRAKQFDMDLDLKLGFLLGTVKVGGSASYLNQAQTMSKTERVSCYFQATTHYEGLTMSHLESLRVTYPEVITKNLATHVCIGIEYGARAVFMFERTESAESCEKHYKGKLYASVSMLPSALSDVGSHPGFKNQKDEMNMDNDVTVKYFGDIHLESAPTTFEAAMEAVRRLPGGVDDSSAVAVKVHLLSLSQLDSKAVEIVPIAPDEIITYLEDALSGLKATEEHISEMLEDDVCKMYSEIDTLLRGFQRRLKSCKRNFISAVRQELSDYRSARKWTWDDLDNHLERLYNSPFDPLTLQSWIEKQRTKLSYLRQLLSAINYDTVEKDMANVMSKIATIPRTLLFSLEIGHQDLETEMDAMKAEAAERISTRASSTLSEAYGDFQKLLFAFKRFVESNSENKNAPLLILVPGVNKSLPAQHLSGTLTYYSPEGEVKPFLPPQSPKSPVFTEVSSNVVTVEWDPPGYGKDYVTGYEVMYWNCDDPTVSTSRDGCLISVHANVTSVRIDKLNPVSWCSVKIRCLSRAGWGPWSTEIRKQTTRKLREEYNLLLLGACGELQLCASPFMPLRRRPLLGLKYCRRQSATCYCNPNCSLVTRD